VIRLNHDYHIVELNRQLTAEVRNWLETKFGLGTGERWFYKNNRIYFADARDHMMFVLVWGDK
jgi:hypothetical protein